MPVPHSATATTRVGDSIAGAAAPRETLERGAALGRYLILSLVGRGGMGEVYAAYDPELDRRVAVKLLHTAHGSEGAGKRMMREARALGKLSHPNVVQVYDVGEHEGDVFVAMELVEGESLEAYCQGTPSPSWREVLAAYIDAARGLGAAHEKGIVHRDVKPSNILRGKDGRVCVADFGLAAASEERPPASLAPASLAPASGHDEAPRAQTPEHGAGPGSPRRSLTLDPGREASSLAETMPAPSHSGGDQRLTMTGVLMGTPLFMAPEQYDGPEVSPACDQHSLCTALYQGLYGTLPFTVDTGTHLFALILAGKKKGPPPSPPAGSPVPAWVYRALARGLAPKPEDRYPSMAALIAALSTDPDARDPDARRRAPWVAWRNAALGVAAVLVVALAAVRSGAFKDPCAHPERQLAGVWDESLKERVRAAFLATGRPYAEGTVTRVFTLLDRYGASWATMRGEVCGASRDDRQRREILTLRDVCLDRRRGQLQALAGLFAEKPDPEVLDKAVQAAASLAPLAYCADTEALTARVRPPEDPALRARVASLQPRVDRLEALFTAGKYKDGLALGEPLLAEAKAVGYPPLHAAVAYWMARLRDPTGDPEGAKALLREASLAAAEGNDDVLAAAAWARLLFVVGERQQRLEEASVLRALGPTVVARAHDERTLAQWLSAEGLTLYRMGKYAEAKANHERALAIRERILDPGNPEIASSLTNLGLVLDRMGDHKQALVMHERSVAVREKAYGPSHPDVAAALNNLGNTLENLGEFSRAKATREQALAVWEKALGPENTYVALPLMNLGRLLCELGDYPQALALNERARAILEKSPGRHPNLALALSNIASAHEAQGDYAQALALYERVLAIQEESFGKDHTQVADVLVGLGRVRVRLGQLDAARADLERALAIKEKAEGASSEIADPLLALGELHVARRHPETAVPLLERALAAEAPGHEIPIRLALAEALWQVGTDRPRARELAEQARAAYERMGHRPGLERATRWLDEHRSP